MKISGEEYKYIADFVQERSGIELGDNKEYFVESRLQPVLAKHNLASFRGLIDLMRSTPADTCLLKDLINAMTTNESLFFRDTQPFEILKNQVVPALMKARQGTKRLRIWSAACSTGQEPYSILMCFEEMGVTFDGWEIDLIATDLAECALERARAGFYSDFEVRRGLSPEMLKKYFVKVEDGWQVIDSIRRRVMFTAVNLIHPFPPLGTFDVVFCRNVLIYFNVETKKRVLTEIARVVAPDGYLVLGGAETSLGLCDYFEKLPEVTAPIYGKAGRTASR